MTGKADLNAANWIKSSLSSGGANCVEVSFLDGVAAVRDSKVPHGPAFTVAPESFAAFLGEVKGGDLAPWPPALLERRVR
jgi:hypothetical protein